VVAAGDEGRGSAGRRRQRKRQSCRGCLLHSGKVSPEVISLRVERGADCCAGAEAWTGKANRDRIEGRRLLSADSRRSDAGGLTSQSNPLRTFVATRRSSAMCHLGMTRAGLDPCRKRFDSANSTKERSGSDPPLGDAQTDHRSTRPGRVKRKIYYIAGRTVREAGMRSVSLNHSSTNWIWAHERR
jgi:hypothetical protein